MAMFLLCGALGKAVLRFNLKNEQAPPEQLLIELLLGYGLWLYVFFAMGLLGLFNRWAFLVWAVASAILLRSSIVSFINESLTLVRQGMRRVSGLGPGQTEKILLSTALALTLIIAVIHLFTCHTPGIVRDDLSYHLYLPKAYLNMGRMAPPPFDQAQSYYPQILNLIYVPLMAFGGELAAKMMNFFWAIVLALLAACLAARVSGSARSGLAAGLALFGSPVLLQHSSIASTDIAAAGFCLGGFLAFLLYREEKTPLWITAALAALALNKYTVWSYWAALIVCFIAVERKNISTIGRGLAMFGLSAAFALGPFCLYLWVIRGNPLYPMPAFGLPFIELEWADRLGTSMRRDSATLGSYFWSRFFSGRVLETGPYVAFIPAALLLNGFWRNNRLLLSAWIALGFIPRCFATGEHHLIARYNLSMHAAAAALALAAWWLARETYPKARGLLNILFAAGIIFPNLAASGLNALPALKSNFKSSGDAQFLERYYPSEGWEMVQFVNRLPPESRVAALDHHFMPYHYRDLGGFIRQAPYRMLLLNDPKEIEKTLRREKITHVLFVTSQWRLLKSASGYLWEGAYSHGFVQCRWWEHSQNLGFLEAIFKSKGGILFKLKRT